MHKRGPYRTVVASGKSGEHGRSAWVVELSCGHVVNLGRRPPRDRMCCTACAPADLPDAGVLDMTDTYAAVELAGRLGLDSEQVSVFQGSAQVTFDAFQLRRFLL